MLGRLPEAVVGSEQDQQPNSQGPLQNQNVEPLVQNLIKNFKMETAEHLTKPGAPLSKAMSRCTGHWGGSCWGCCGGPQAVGWGARQIGQASLSSRAAHARLWRNRGCAEGAPFLWPQEWPPASHTTAPASFTPASQALLFQTDSLLWSWARSERHSLERCKVGWGSGKHP